MKKLLALCLVALVGTMTAQAGTFKLGAGTPFVSIAIPDSWEPEGDENVVAGSNHGAFLSAEPASGTEINSLIDQAVDFLSEQGVEFDQEKIEKSEKEFNGLPTVIVSTIGKDKEGPAQVGLIITLLPNDKALLVTYWGPVGENKDLVDDLNSIMGSIKPLSK
jgi:hypothetical protein